MRCTERRCTVVNNEDFGWGKVIVAKVEIELSPYKLRIQPGDF